jgi:hypothetical protein
VAGAAPSKAASGMQPASSSRRHAASQQQHHTAIYRTRANVNKSHDVSLHSLFKEPVNVIDRNMKMKLKAKKYGNNNTFQFTYVTDTE